MKIKKARTERGFRRWDFADRYGQKCSLQKSSLAGEEAIWFGVDVNIPKELGGEGKEVHERMHLTQKMVKQLLPALQHFAEKGELP